MKLFAWSKKLLSLYQNSENCITYNYIFNTSNVMMLILKQGNITAKSIGKEMFSKSKYDFNHNYYNNFYIFLL